MCVAVDATEVPLCVCVCVCVCVCGCVSVFHPPTASLATGGIRSTCISGWHLCCLTDDDGGDRSAAIGHWQYTATPKIFLKKQQQHKKSWVAVVVVLGTRCSRGRQRPSWSLTSCFSGLVAIGVAQTRRQGGGRWKATTALTYMREKTSSRKAPLTRSA